MWLGALEHALAAIEGYGPQVLLVALGLDAHGAFDDQGGAVTTLGFRDMAVNIATVNLQTGNRPLVKAVISLISWGIIWQLPCTGRRVKHIFN